MKRPILLALAALSLLAPAHAVRAADKPMVYHDGARQLPAATAVQLNAASTANASVNLGQGVAPTSPVDGDSWMTSAGFYYRAGGITFGPITLSSVTCGAPLTGGTITTTGTCGIAANGLALSYLAQIGGNSYLGNQSTTTGNVTAYAWPTCASGQFLAQDPTHVPPVFCATPATVPSGSNPFAIGSIDIEQIIGAPSASTLPAGSLLVRSDSPELWQLLTSSAAVPAVVQSASATGSSVVMTATPAAGDTMVAVCSDYPGTPGTGSGWTPVQTFGVGANIPSLVIVRKLATAAESTTQTPCSGSTGTAVFEVSGVSDWTMQFEGAFAGNSGSAGPSVTLGFTTDKSNTLVLGVWRDRDAQAGSVTAGLTQALTNATSVAGGADQFPTNGSGVSATGTFPGGCCENATLIKITPGLGSSVKLSDLSTIQNAGSPISTSPYLLNCVAPVTCSASTDTNGLDKINLTSSAPTGSGSTGALAKWTSSTALGAGDLSGDCTTSGTLAVTCLKTNGVAFGAFATANAATPPAIGGTTPAAGTFTALGGSSLNISGASTLSGAITTGVTGSTQCLHVNSSGVVSGTASDCGSASGAAISGTPTAGNCASWLNATTLQDAGAACGSGGGGSTTLVHPGGRLTLESGHPVPNGDQVAKATLYYDCAPAQGGSKYVPYYNGTADALDTIGSCEVSDAMAASGTGVLNASDVFDVYWDPTNHNICVVTNGSGAGWSGDTGGSTVARGSGYSALPHMTRGYYTNPNTLTHCYNGATDYGSASADLRSYLGSIYTTAAGQTGMAFKPAGTSGGNGNCLCVYNAYQQHRMAARSLDTASHAYTTAAWRASAGSANNRISWVDGLQDVFVSATFNDAGQEVSCPGGPRIGIDFDSTSATPESEGITNSCNNGVWSMSTIGSTPPLLGLHFAQEVELGGSASSVFGNCSPAPCSVLRVDVEMALGVSLPGPGPIPTLLILLPAFRRRRAANDNAEREAA